MEYAYGSEDYYAGDSAVYDGSAMYEAGSDVMVSDPPRPAGPAVVTAEELLAQTVNERVARVSKTMNVSDATATFLLAASKFDPERTITAFFENAPRAAAAAGVTVVQPPAVPEVVRVAKGDCSVCFDDDVECLHLGCGHAECLSCWRNNIEFRLTSSGSRAWFGLCPVPKCGRPAGDAVTAVAAPDLLPRLHDRLARCYVECANNSLACAGPACDRFIVCPCPRTQMPQGPGSCVLCRHCETSTCVHCAQPNHLPTNCADLKKWISREHEDSANANWIMANTKQCPKCHNAIEKNSGCNHMTCKHCNHHFCWICMNDWMTHEGGAQGGYSCNKYVKNERVAVAQAELEKYIHYYSRFRIHERSRELDSAITRKAREIIDAMVQAMRAKLHELNYWERAASVLSSCRRTLMYSYIYAYYLPTETPKDKGAKDLFEYQQAQLEHSTENLSELVTIHAQRPDHVTQTVAEEVIKRTAIAEQMLRQIEAGLGQYDHGRLMIC